MNKQAELGDPGCFAVTPAESDSHLTVPEKISLFLVISALKRGSCYRLFPQALGERSPNLSQDTSFTHTHTWG